MSRKGDINIEFLVKILIALGGLVLLLGLVYLFGRQALDKIIEFVNWLLGGA